VKEDEITGNIDFRARGQRRTLWADEHIFEVKFQILFNAHGALLFWLSPEKHFASLWRPQQ
jgi:hypothetical protein